LGLTEETCKDTPTEIAVSCSNLANNLQNFSEHWEEAEQLFERCLDIQKVHLDADDPNLAITFSSFGSFRLNQKRFSDAVDLTEKAAEINKSVHGEFSAPYAIRLNNLGAIYGEWFQESQNPEHKTKERNLKAQSADITRQMVGWRNPLTTTDFNNLAVMYYNDDDFTQAANNMLHAVAIDLSLSQFEHPLTLQHIQHLLLFWLQSNQGEKFEKLISGDLTILVDAVHYIEAQHREWMANRHS